MNLIKLTLSPGEDCSWWKPNYSSTKRPCYPCTAPASWPSKSWAQWGRGGGGARRPLAQFLYRIFFLLLSCNIKHRFVLFCWYQYQCASASSRGALSLRDSTEAQGGNKSTCCSVLRSGQLAAAPRSSFGSSNTASHTSLRDGKGE